VRFLSVLKQYPDEAEELFAACQEMAKKRYRSYVRMTKMDWNANIITQKWVCQKNFGTPTFGFLRGRDIAKVRTYRNNF
jgi:hypothetical protein